jgi:protoporphyrinogen IX oxidase
MVRAIAAVIAAAILFALLVVWNPTRLVLWLKAFHVIAVIAWMAGMLYLPRLSTQPSRNLKPRIFSHLS